MGQPRTSLRALTMMAPPARPGPERQKSAGMGGERSAGDALVTLRRTLYPAAWLCGVLVTPQGRDAALYLNLCFSMVFWRPD